MPVDLPDDLELLRTLHVLLAERHVTRAASKLGITQSAASQRLSRLRSYLGDELLVPGRPTMIPTPRARMLEEPLTIALANLRAAMASGAAFQPSTETRRFTLLGNDLAETLAVPLIVASASVVAPHVTWSMERVDGDYVSRLETGTADLAFVPDFMVVKSLRRKPLPPARFELVMRAGHPLATARSISLASYLSLRHVLVAPRGAPGGIVDSLLARTGHQRTVAVRVQHFIPAAFIVARSDLVVTLPAQTRQAVQPELALVHRTLPFELPVDRTSIVWHERVHLDPGHRWLRELLFGVFER